MQKLLLTFAVLGAVLSTGCTNNDTLRAQVAAEALKMTKLQTQHQQMAHVQHDIARVQNRIRATQAEIARLKKR